MSTRFWSALYDLYSESEEELDDVAVDTYGEKSEQDDSLHGAKYEVLNKNPKRQKTMESKRPSLDFRSKFQMDLGYKVGDVIEDAIVSDSEVEDETRDYAFEKWRSLRDRYLNMCEEIDLDATLDEKRIIIPENNRKYELLKREGATPTDMIRVFLMMIRNHMFTWSAPHGMDPCSMGHMPLKAWKRSVEDLYVVLDILKGSDIVIGRKRGLKRYKGKTFIFGNLVELLEIIDIHLLKRSQCVDLGPQELLEVMRSEYFLYDLCQNFQQYFASIQDYRSAAKSALIMMGIVYYKNKDMYDVMRGVASVEFDVKVATTPGFGTKPVTFPERCLDLMYDLACFISKHGGSKTITHATLCYIYNLAIMDQHLEAVIVLCDSGLSNCRHTSVDTAILYNRTLAQLGLCSFRVGAIEDAHKLLHNFQDCEWSKKLLNQGEPGRSLPCDDVEQEFLSRCKQMPRHMHIDLQQLQLGYHLCDEILDAGSQPKGAVAEVKLTGMPKDVEDHIGVVRKWDFSKLSNLTESPDFWVLRKNIDGQLHQL